jgi:hypothetical protein
VVVGEQEQVGGEGRTVRDMEQEQFDRLLQLFPVVRPRTYCADDFNGLTVQSQSLAQREDEPLLSPPPPAVPEVIVKLFLFCVRCLYGGLSTVLFHGSGSVNGPATMIYHSIDLTNEKT